MFKIIDIQGDKVALSLKALKEDPWLKVAEKYNKGEVVDATVTKFNSFGAFVQLNEEIHGLVHISEFGTEAKMREALEVGKRYSFRVLLVEPKEHRMSLGLVKDQTGIPAADAAQGSLGVVKDEKKEEEK